MTTIAEEFAALSPDQRKLLELALQEKGIVVDRLAITPRSERREHYPVSYAQERLWFLAQLDPAGSAYHIPTPVALAGDLDVPALRKAVVAVVARHEALRTVFTTFGSQPVQVVREGFRQPLPAIDLQALAPETLSRMERRLTAATSRRPFDLSTGPLLRTVLLRVAPARHRLLLVMHHIVSDGWSMGIFFRELWTLYRAFSRGEGSPLSPLALQYVDFAVWQRGWLDEQVLGQQVDYWRQRLAGAPAVLALPLDRPRPALQSAEGAGLGFHIDPALTAAVRRLARAERTTPFVVLLALFQVLLARVTGQPDVVVGSPHAGRVREAIEPLIGFFVNSLALRTTLDGAWNLHQCMAAVRETVEGANAHSDLPFAKLVSEISPQRSLDHSPIYQVDFAYQMAPSQGLELEGLQAAMVRADNPSAPFDLSISLTDREEWITGTVLFKVELFDATSIQRLSNAYLRLAAGALAQPETPVLALPLLAAAERHQLLLEDNDTAAESLDRGRYDHRQAASLADLLVARMRTSPHRVALSCEGRFVSYGELDRRSADLAAALVARGAAAERVVAVCAERSIELVVALVATVRAGAAYLPIDPAYPPARQALLLEEADAAVVLTQAALAEHLPAGERPLLLLDAGGPSAAEPGQASAAGAVIHGEGAAYVIFTSGSTGRPKGVVNSHRGIVNRLLWMQRAYRLDPSDRVLQKTPFTFDVSVWEFFWPLVAGAELVVARPEGHKDAAYLAELVTGRRVTTLHFVPSMLSIFLEERGLTGGAACDALRRVICSGEALTRETARRFFERFGRSGRPAPALENLYGPTEAAIDVTRWPVDPATLEQGLSLPIGRSIANLEVHLLDGHGEPAGFGLAAELLIGGAGLARGYLGRPALTAERFVPHPRGSRPGARLYRTGDLARRRADGAAEFLGRLDHQVKVRGFRVELGEIEAVLADATGVRDAVVTALPDASGAHRLVAYLTAFEGATGDAESELSTAGLRAWLGERLPEYMVPGVYVVLDALPLTVSGKVDRKALPEPGAGRLATGSAFVEPRGRLERVLVEIWRELLEIDIVGREDNFFDLGGHSLLVIRLRERLLDELGANLPVVDLFRYPTVGRLAEHIRGFSAPEAQSSGREARIGEARALRRTEGRATAEAIAIVGMAGRFPRAPDVETLWSNLLDGVEAITFYSDEELAAAGVPEAVLADPNYVKAQSVLEGIDQLDAGLFGVSAREAQLTDPQQRLFLECAWQALEHAGFAPESFDGAIGVYGGVGMNNYWLKLLANPKLMQEIGLLAAMLGNNKDFLATRVSYKLKLDGPSFDIQTACSTSLVATHLACQALLAHECDLALVGGVNAGGREPSGYWYQEGGILSPDGHCRAFDADGAGVISGSAVGMVVLRRLSEAVADGDTVWAVIRGSAINNDGANKVGFTAPSVEGQARVIAEALAVAKLDAAAIGYVETHGTATPLGDSIEVAALTEVFGPGPQKSCALGSIKTNIGHCDAAAGVAGLIKATLCVAHGEIPASLNFSRPNPNIDFAHSPFFVAAERTSWPGGGDQPRRAGVSSFGLGGTNAHVVLEQAPPVPAVGEALGARAAEEGALEARPWHLLTLSAATPHALDAATQQLAEALAQDEPVAIEDVAHTLHLGRRRLAYRRTLVCSDAADAAAALAARDPRRLLESAVGPDLPGSGRPVAFLLPGVGDQYPGMAAELYRTEPVFRDAADRCAGILQPLVGEDLRQRLFEAQAQAHNQDDDGAAAGVDLRAMLGRGPAASPPGQGDQREADLSSARLAHPAVFMVEYALALLWIACGIVPEALLGYSLGEYVAACLAGVLSLEDALGLVTERAALIEALPEGGMLAVPLPAVEVAHWLSTAAGLAVAAINAPRVTVVSGPLPAIEALARALEQREIVSQRLATRHAFHSPMLQPAAGPLIQRAARVKLSAPRIPYLSNVTGDWITPEQATDPGYWARHLCGTVRFAEGLERLLAEPERILLEVGPGQALSTAARQHPAADAAQVVVSSIRDARERRSDGAVLLEALGRLWLAGADIDWNAFAAGRGYRRVPLPTYPFERQSYWLEAPAPQVPAAAQAAGRKAGGRVPEIADWFHLPYWRPTAAAVPRGDRLAERVAGCWLLVADEAGLADRLAARLAALGARTILVRWSDSAAAGEPEERIDPGDSAAWSRLVERLRREERLPDHVVLLAPATHAADAEQLLAAQQRGLFAIVELVRSLVAAGVTDPVRLAVVARGLYGTVGNAAGSAEAGGAVPERAAPGAAHAGLVGALRVIPQEYRNFETLTVDLDSATLGGAMAPSSERLDALLTDLAAGPERNLSYRHDGRWRLDYAPVAVDTADGAEPRWRQGGVYLITGGFGLVGRTLSSWLAREHRARLVLVGRAELPERSAWDAWLAAHGEEDPASRRIAHVRHLEEQGAEVLALAADVAEREDMRHALRRVSERFGALNGVVHLAGATARKELFVPLDQTDRAACMRQLSTKAAGSALLAELLDGIELDFVVLFSSLSSVLGGLGFTAYAAANSFLDAFAAHRCALGGSPWIAINWDGWREVGQEASEGALSMAPEEAVEALRRALTLLPAPQVVVSVGELQSRLARWVRFEQDTVEAAPEAAAEGTAAYQRPAFLQTPYVAPRGETETTIAGLWGRMLGIEGIGVHDNFFQLGGDSLLATQLASRLRAALKVEVPLRVFFAAPTVAQMAAELASGGGEMQEELSEIEVALREIEGLSEEELALELAEEDLPEEPHGAPAAPPQAATGSDEETG